jgi:phosphotransferase system HPr (HPr) family protein
MIPIVKKKIKVQNDQGLHARPAALFVQLANRFSSNITVRKGRREASGKSIMGILTLAIGKGSQIEMICDGEDAEKACHSLEKLLLKELE